MAQRNSGYARLADDLYITPAWVWNELWEVAPWARDAFDCAPVERNGYDFLTDCRLLTHQMPDGGMERNIAVMDLARAARRFPYCAT